jgi:hypothetical protein
MSNRTYQIVVSLISVGISLAVLTLCLVQW